MYSRRLSNINDPRSHLHAPHFTQNLLVTASPLFLAIVYGHGVIEPASGFKRRKEWRKTVTLSDQFA
jgi:hypothetical protein